MVGNNGKQFLSIGSHCKRDAVVAEFGLQKANQTGIDGRRRYGVMVPEGILSDVKTYLGSVNMGAIPMLDRNLAYTGSGIPFIGQIGRSTAEDIKEREMYSRRKE